MASYSIQPRVMFQLTATASVQGSDLHRTMQRVDPLLGRAAAAPGPPRG